MPHLEAGCRIEQQTTGCGSADPALQRPSGTLKVTTIDRNPTYHYNPAYHFKGVDAKSPFVIAPGPNNPVGTVWISLSAEGYGMHGTPEPGRVSKAASHGCVRLTNWDAQRLAMEVSKGTPVTVVDNSG